MDQGHFAYLKAHAPETDCDKRAALALFLDKTTPGAEVRDPYYGDKSDFRRMLDDIEQGVHDWLDFFANTNEKRSASKA